jgi:hypothetical protein
MTLRRMMIAGLCATALACGKTEGDTPGLRAECLRNADCADPFTCIEGTCQLNPWQTCTDKATRCNGDVIETCAKDPATELATWTKGSQCPTGCANGECRPSACAPQTKQCVYAKDAAGNNVPGTAVIERCDASGIGYEHFLSCPFGCATDTTTNTVRCVESECQPFSTTCKAGDPTKLLTCNKYGVKPNDTTPLYTETSCSSTSTCVAGRCVEKVCQVNRGAGGSINFREERCSGSTKEVCNDTQTAFEPVEICALGCSYNATEKTARCGVANCKTGPAATDVASAGTTRCKPNDATQSLLQTCSNRSTGTEWVESSCTSASGAAVCVDGQCLPKACTVTRTGSATMRQERCSGRIREECDDTQSFFRPIVETASDANPCPYGCVIDANNRAKCKVPSCEWRGGVNPDQRCAQVGSGASATFVLEQCNELGDYQPIQYCPAGCTSPTAGTARCLTLGDAGTSTCNPLSSRCALDASTNLSYVELCRANGSGYDRAASACAQGCTQTGTGTDTRAYCRVIDAQCTAGEVRCQGAQAQQCVRLSNGATEWRMTDECIGSCNSGACNSAGACGCAGGPSASLPMCGVDARQPVGVRVLASLPTGVTAYPCDGVSRLLVYTDPITSSNGQLVPDGTLVTFSQDGNDTLLASPDADLTKPGLQRPTLRGRARMLVNAPLQAGCTDGVTRTLRVTATVAGACSGFVGIPFRGSSSTTRNVYLAEDFASVRYRDWAVLDENDAPRQAAAWDVRAGILSAQLATNLGTGRDGDLVVGASSASSLPTDTRNLNVTGDIRSFHVTAVGTQDVLTESVTVPFAAGEEVLLINLHGSNNGGNYEFKRIASIGAGRIVFTEPVRFTYGAVSNADLSNQRVVVQRVPHYRNVTVWHNGVLTMNGPTVAAGVVTAQSSASVGSGVLAFRATGTVRVLGRISMDAKGLNASGGGIGFPISQTSQMNKLQLGTGSNGPGGGAIYVSAGTLTFRESGFAGTFPDSAEITANTSATSGRGGPIWIATGKLEVDEAARAIATAMVRSTGPGSNGFIRADYSSTDALTTHYASPNTAPRFYIGQGGAFWAQSSVAYREQTAGASIRSATLLGVIGGVGASEVRLGGAATSSIFTNYSVEGNAVDGAPNDWRNLSEMQRGDFLDGQSPLRGQLFKWRISIKPMSDVKHEFLGLSLRLTAQ